MNAALAFAVYQLLYINNLLSILMQIGFAVYLQGPFHKDSDFLYKKMPICISIFSHTQLLENHKYDGINRIFDEKMFSLHVVTGVYFLSHGDTKKCHPRICNEKRRLCTRHIAGFVFVLSSETLRSHGEILKSLMNLI